jgi:hypothetical protein
LRFRHGSLLAAGLASAVGLANGGPADDSQSDNSTTLAYQPCPEWAFVLPKETWLAADEVCGIPHSGNVKGFAVEQTGVMALEIDTNGDGELDARIKGDRGFAKLRGKDSQGNPIFYAVRFKFEERYKWAPAGVMAGKIKGQTLRLIDQNGNGEYDDYGVDAMIVGGGNAACFLSKVVNLGGDLYDFKVSTDGSKVEVQPFAGESGVLDLASKFSSNGTLIAAVLVSGDTSFNVADGKTGMKLPVGKYELFSGFVEKAGETCWIKKGKSRPIEVASGANLTVAWGGPVFAEFGYQISGEQITVPPDVHFYGQTGEEYHSFRPEAKSPKILVTDKATGKLVASGRFGGC